MKGGKMWIKQIFHIKIHFVNYDGFFIFRLPYKELLGGVAAWKTKEFEQVNGWSNLFVNWGGEDDDLSYRFCFL